MAASKKSKETILNYNAEIRALTSGGPGRLYMLYGPEEYLRDRYLEKLRSMCLPEGDTGFSYTKFDGPDLNIHQLEDSVNLMPFLSDRTFIELRDIDINKLRENDSEQLLAILKDIPDYCTICFVMLPGFEPDGKKKLSKFIDSKGKSLRFTHQSQGALLDWITRRFAAANKSINMESAQRLIFVSGDIMSKLIPEIDKIAAYAPGQAITVADINAIANHIPEADVFEAIEMIADKKCNQAADAFAVLLSDKSIEPLFLISLLGAQFKKLYLTKLAIQSGRGADYVSSTLHTQEFIARKYFRTAQALSLEYLKSAVSACCDADLQIKSSSQGDTDILKTTFARIVLGV